jgi:hypothetical protein
LMNAENIGVLVVFIKTRGRRVAWSILHAWGA